MNSNIINNQRNFNNFVRQIENLVQDHTFWDEMMMLKYKGKYNKNPDFWWIVFRSVQDRTLMNLHEIFTDKRDTLNVFTLYKNIDDDEEIKILVQEILCRQCVMKMRLKDLRNKFIAHKNKSMIDKEIGDLGEHYHITIGCLNDIINDLYEFINLTKKIFGNEDADYNQRRCELVNNTKSDLSKIILSN